ncbi:hypothetical protein [Priestia megaterium]|uniref:hypothetical protein n=1 Tax=Priestia megaterium TaxID=1404 RepID=UPI00177F5BD6|nr:hypothetical protein [Priestia megaterium]MBD8848410.1 hypothetical protein [Priestia megaterium]
MQSIKFSKKTYIISAILLIIIPIVVNELMSFHVVKVYGDTNAWIGFLGSYFGSIISGVITLIGVLLTLQFSQKESKKALDLTRKEARRNQLPAMIARTQECLDIIDEVLPKIYDLEKADIEELKKRPHHRSLRLFIVDDEYMLQKTETCEVFEKEMKEARKLLRNHMVQIDENAYKCFRRFEQEFTASYHMYIKEIENELMQFQGDVVTKYMYKYAHIIHNLEHKLNTIPLNKDDVLRLEKILRKLQTNEPKYISNFSEIYDILENDLNKMLIRFSEEFSVK